jgi:hypothetical protein
MPKKLQHVRLDNFIHLTGFAPEVAASFAHALDGTVNGAMTHEPLFARWRRGAKHDQLSHGTQNFTFHALRVVRSEGPVTAVFADQIETEGKFGQARRGAFVNFWSQHDPTQQTLVSLPLVYLLREHGPIDRLYTLYEHGAIDYNGTVDATLDAFRRGNGEGYPFPRPTGAHGSNAMLYVGVTGRSWGIRFKEHLDAARGGSLRPFHRALREDFGRFNTRFHYVLAMMPDKHSAFMHEEHAVQHRDCVYPKGLNAIPGGYEGLRHLARMNALSMLGKSGARVRLPAASGGQELDLEPDAAEDIMEGHMRRQTLARVAAAGASDAASEGLATRWRDADFAERMVTSQDNRLSLQQVRLARYEQLLGRSAREIAESIGARDVEVVKRLLDGKTYVRVRDGFVDLPVLERAEDRHFGRRKP